MSRPHVLLDLLLAQRAANRIPHDGEHAQHRREHAPRHREYASRVPPVVLQEWPHRQARQVRRRRVPCGVARRGQVLRKALLRERWRRQNSLRALLHLYRRLDKSHREAGFQVPLNVAYGTTDVSA